MRDEDDQLAAAPTTEAMDDCVAVDRNGQQATITHWMNEVPCGTDVEAVCYF